MYVLTIHDQASFSCSSLTFRSLDFELCSRCATQLLALLVAATLFLMHGPFITLHAGPSEGCNVAALSLHCRGRLGCRTTEPSVLRIITVMVKIVALRRWLYFVAALRLLSGERPIIISQQDPA